MSERESLWAVGYLDFAGRQQSQIVTAESAEAAVEQMRKACSVGAFKRGVVFSVWRLGNYPEKFHIAYDGEPLTESHGATGAKLVTKALGRSHV